MFSCPLGMPHVFLNCWFWCFCGTICPMGRVSLVLAPLSSVAPGFGPWLFFWNSWCLRSAALSDVRELSCSSVVELCRCHRSRAWYIRRCGSYPARCWRPVGSEVPVWLLSPLCWGNARSRGSCMSGDRRGHLKEGLKELRLRRRM